MPGILSSEGAALASRLREVMVAENLTQKALELRIGVDQAAISRALHGKLRRRSAAFEKLWSYANMSKSRRVPAAAAAAFKRYVDVGGDMTVLCSAIDLLGEAQARARSKR
jgi:transcriptional regulator with XRE-family HTH domain